MRNLIACEEFVSEFGIPRGYDYLLYALAWIFSFILYEIHPAFGIIQFVLWYVEFLWLLHDKILIGKVYLSGGKDAALAVTKSISSGYYKFPRIIFHFLMWLVLRPISIILDVLLGDSRFLPWRKK